MRGWSRSGWLFGVLGIEVGYKVVSFRKYGYRVVEGLKSGGDVELRLLF